MFAFVVVVVSLRWCLLCVCVERLGVCCACFVFVLRFTSAFASCLLVVLAACVLSGLLVLNP